MFPTGFTSHDSHSCNFLLLPRFLESDCAMVICFVAPLILSDQSEGGTNMIVHSEVRSCLQEILTIVIKIKSAKFTSEVCTSTTPIYLSLMKNSNLNGARELLTLLATENLDVVNSTRKVSPKRHQKKPAVIHVMNVLNARE